MQFIKPFFYSLLLLTLLLASCSVEKRHYTGGYYLQWKHANKLNSPKEAVAKVNSDKKVVEVEKHLPQNKDALFASASTKKEIYLSSPDSIGCDTLIMKNGTEIKVKVTEITPTEIKYKHCNNLDGPTYVVYRYDVSYIKYANGSLDSFTNEHPPQQQKPNNNYNRGGYSGGYNRPSTNNIATAEYVRTRSLASLILGILSFFIPYVGLLFALLAVIMGKRSMNIIRREQGDLWFYARRATAGLVLGWIVIGLYLIIIAALLIALALI